MKKPDNGRRLRHLVVAIVFITLAVSLIYTNFSTPKEGWIDEKGFIVISQHPERVYSTSEWVDEWVSKALPGTTWDEDWVQSVWGYSYWINPPLATYLVYPLTSLTEDLHLLRLVSVGLFLASIYLIFLSLRREGYKQTSLFCLIAVLLVISLCQGAVKFYYNAFLGFFFALSWYLVVIESRWKYLTAVALVLSKVYAPILLIPLILKDKNWKLILPGLAFAVYYIGGWIVNGDMLWLTNYWFSQYYWITEGVTEFIGSKSAPGVMMYRFLPYLVLTLPGLRYIKTHYAEASFYGLAFLLYFGWNWAFYQVPLSVIAMPLMMAPWVDLAIPKLEEWTKFRGRCPEQV